MSLKQVNKQHYEFNRYMEKNRWISIWHQLDEVLSLKPSSVLEIGSGSGVFKTVAGQFGLCVDTVDIDPELLPDYVASACYLPFENDSYDCVCAFQVLEHLPYKKSLEAFKEMARVANKYVVVSLPNAKTKWLFTIHVPIIGIMKLHITKPKFKKRINKFNGEHYWELNKVGYGLKEVVLDFEKINVKLLRSYRVHENPYHMFFVFKVNC